MENPTQTEKFGLMWMQTILCIVWIPLTLSFFIPSRLYPLQLSCLAWNYNACMDKGGKVSFPHPVLVARSVGVCQKYTSKR